MDKSADYQKAIAEAKESIQMLVEEYKQTTMSPTLIGRFYDEEKHRSEVEQAEERNLEEIKRDTESGMNIILYASTEDGITWLRHFWMDPNMSIDG